MIFNNSKKLHRLINCWGPGEGPGGSLGGASADGGMGGTGSMGGNTSGDGMGGGPTGGNLTGITSISPFTSATSPAMSPQAMDWGGVLSGALTGLLSGGYLGAAIGAITSAITASGNSVSEAEAMGLVTQGHTVAVDSTTGGYSDMGPSSTGQGNLLSVSNMQQYANGDGTYTIPPGNYAGDSATPGTPASYEQQALNYLISSDKLPRQLRESALKKLGGAYGVEGGTGSQQDMINSAKNSPLYNAIMGTQKSGEEAIMRNASATGGLRSGNVQSNMYDYNVQLGNKALLESYNEQMTGLSGLAGLGSNANTVANTMMGISGNITNRDNTAALQATALRQESNDESQQSINNWMGVGKFGLDLYNSGIFSDIRLKSNIKQLRVAKGHNWYSWVWNKAANKLGLKGRSEGVIADEIKLTNPDCVGSRFGYLTVNYTKLGLRIKEVNYAR